MLRLRKLGYRAKQGDGSRAGSLLFDVGIISLWMPSSTPGLAVPASEQPRQVQGGSGLWLL